MTSDTADLLDEAPTLDVEEAPTALYRFFDADDRLLYVGISCDIGSRWRQHEKDKPWWRDVTRATVEHFDSRSEALDAELAAIKAERPLWNYQGNNDAPINPRLKVARRYAGDGPFLTVREAQNRLAAAGRPLSDVAIRTCLERNYLRGWYTATGRHARIEPASVDELVPLLKIKKARARNAELQALARRNRGEPDPE